MTHTFGEATLAVLHGCWGPLRAALTVFLMASITAVFVIESL